MKRFLSRIWLAAAAAVILTAAGCSSAASPAQTPSLSATGSSGFTQDSGKISSRISSSPVSPFASGQNRTVSITSSSVENNSRTGSRLTSASPHIAVPSRSAVRTTSCTTKGGSSSASPALTTKRTTSAAKGDSRITVTFSVDCSSAVAAGNDIAAAVSSDGIILRPTALVLEEGASVFDALEKSGLVVVSSKGPFGVYIKSIQSLAEKACGRQSGWLYSVNGKYPGYSCSKYTLKEGDVVRWRYSCDGSENG